MIRRGSALVLGLLVGEYKMQTILCSVVMFVRRRRLLFIITSAHRI